MTKKLLSIILAITMAVCMIPMSAFAITYSEDKELSELYVADDTTVEKGVTLTFTDFASTIYAEGNVFTNYGTIRAAYDSLQMHGCTFYNYGVYSMNFYDVTVYDLTLSSIALSSGSISGFSPATTSYAVTVGSDVSSIDITPTLNYDNGNVSMKVNGTSVSSGSSTTVSLATGVNTIEIVLTASDTNNTSNTYTLTVTREEVKTYTVKWCDGDGTELEIDTNVAYGTMPSYDRKEPTKASGIYYHYTFAGWTPEVSEVTGDVTYTATYTETEHTIETQNAKDATCTEDGYTGDEFCTVCQNIVSLGSTIPKTGHTAADPVVENNVPATCTTDGSYDSVVYCSVCDEELSRETITVPATGHTEGEAVVENEVEATCTTDGSYDNVVYCSVCNEELGRETISVPATGHTAAEAVVENEVLATCTEDGSYESVVYCTECSAEISRETVTVEAVGHSYELGACSVCGAKDPDYVTEVTLDAALAETLTSGLVTGVTIRADIGTITVSEAADDHLLQHIVDVMGFTLNNEAHGNWLLSETESFIIRTTENGRTTLKKVTSLFYGDIDFASGATITMELSGSEDLASGTIYVLHYTNGDWQQESYTSSYVDGKLTLQFQPDSASPFLIISVSDYTSSRNNILPLLLQIQSLNQTSTSEETTEEVTEEVVEIDEPVEAGETDTE